MCPKQWRNSQSRRGIKKLCSIFRSNGLQRALHCNENYIRLAAVSHKKKHKVYIGNVKVNTWELSAIFNLLQLESKQVMVFLYMFVCDTQWYRMMCRCVQTTFNAYAYTYFVQLQHDFMHLPSDHTTSTHMDKRKKTAKTATFSFENMISTVGDGVYWNVFGVHCQHGNTYLCA